MIDNLIRDFQVLRKADILIGRIWINVIARRFALLAFAGCFKGRTSNSLITSSFHLAPIDTAVPRSIWQRAANVASAFGGTVSRSAVSVPPMASVSSPSTLR